MDNNNQPKNSPAPEAPAQPVNQSVNQPSAESQPNNSPMLEGQSASSAGQPTGSQAAQVSPAAPMSQGQPGQPLQPAPKQPMDPAKKKKILIWSLVGGGVAVVAIVAAILIPILLRVDYATAYATAKELKPKIYDIYYSYDCEYVVDYVNSAYTSDKNYAGYITDCLDTFSDGASQLVTQLQNTDGIKRNSELSAQFGRFNTEYEKVMGGSADTLAATLELYKVWHSFMVASDDLSYGRSSDVEFTTAANILINSGNDTLKTYGEGWLERSLAVAAAYRAYDVATTNWSSLYDTYRNLYNEAANWVAENKPDITSLAPLDLDDTSKMYSEFTKLYDMISTTYEKNYNSGSGDCTEFLGEVYCD